MMAVPDDILHNAQAKTCALPYWLGGEEVFEEALLHLIGHTLAIIGKGDGKAVGLTAHTHRELGLIGSIGRLRLMPYGIEGIIDQIEHSTTQILRNDPRKRHVILIRLADGDIEVLMVGAHGVIRKPGVLLDNPTHIGGDELALLASGHQQDALNDADGTLAVLSNLGHVLLEVGHDIDEILTIVVRKLVGIVGHEFFKVAEQLIVHLTEIDDEIQRVLDFMGDTCTKHTQ